MRFNGKAEKTVRVVSMLVTVFTLIWLAYFFRNLLFPVCCWYGNIRQSALMFPFWGLQKMDCLSGAAWA